MRIRYKPTDNQTNLYMAELPETPESVLSAGSSEKRIYRVVHKNFFKRNLNFKDLSPVNHPFNLNLKHLAFS